MQMDTASTSHAGSTAESAILEELRAGSVGATELRQRMNRRLGLKAPQLKLVLDALIAARKIHGQPKRGKDGRPTKTIEAYVPGAPPPPPPSARELAPNAILMELRSSTLSPADLKSRLDRRLDPKLTGPELKAALTELLNAKRIFPIYKRDAKGKLGKTIEQYTLQSPPPDDFVNPVVELWRQNRKAAAISGVDDTAFIAALLRALAQDGVKVTNGTATPNPAEDQKEIMHSMRELVSREGQGALIAMRKLRASLELSKDRFDAAVLQLYAADTIILHHHDYVGSLTETERNDLVVDAHGNSYVGVALRGDS